jgi:hypothetical protein
MASNGRLAHRLARAMPEKNQNLVWPKLSAIDSSPYRGGTRGVWEVGRMRQWVKRHAMCYIGIKQRKGVRVLAYDAVLGLTFLASIRSTAAN